MKWGFSKFKFISFPLMLSHVSFKKLFISLAFVILKYMIENVTFKNAIKHFAKSCLAFKTKV
jgi:hypothetical protein